LNIFRVRFFQEEQAGMSLTWGASDAGLHASGRWARYSATFFRIIVNIHVNSRHRYPLAQGLDPRTFDADNNHSFEHSDQLSVVRQAQFLDCRCPCRHLENPPRDRINPWETAMRGVARSLRRPLFTEFDSNVMRAASGITPCRRGPLWEASASRAWLRSTQTSAFSRPSAAPLRSRLSSLSSAAP